MKELFNKVNTQSLIIGIIGTIICSNFIEPILNFLSSTTVFLFKSISNRLYDRLFEEIALGKPDYSYIIIFALNILIINFLLFTIIYSFRKKRTPEELKERIEKRDKKQNGKINKIVFRSITIITFLSTTYAMVLSDIKMKTSQSFEQKIRIITPFIDQHTKDILISDFSRMKNFEDYKKIISFINFVAQKNKIDLPKTSVHIF